PGQFQCTPGDLCYPREWLCDGHPDCEDEGDELGCGSTTPAVTGPWSSAGPPAGSAGTRGGRPWVFACALSSPGLLNILVAAGSLVVWGLLKAKSRSNPISLEKASREQLMPDKSR
ncbi:RSVR protein, partial [Formicarius rufipectus]|nr:RSVR protein [Formicarius rufipectus]